MNLWEQLKHDARGLRVLKDWIGEGGQTVLYADAQYRANVCLAGDNGKACRENQPGGLVREAVALAVKQQVKLKNSLQLRVIGEKSLRECSVCTCPLKLKIWIPIQKIADEMTEGELERYPHWCWQRQEIERLKR